MAPDDTAVRKATGDGWDHWFAIHDSYPDLDHKERVKRFWSEHGDGVGMDGSIGERKGAVSGWWSQMITVEWEKARGKRVEGETSAGDFQVTCSKTVAWDADECFERAVSTPFLDGADWTEGATWQNAEASIEVRRVDPGKIIRWFWHDADGKSTVTLDFWPSANGEKTQIRFSHAQLASLEARDRYRARWKDALAMIVDGA